jgi:hypothetical protein
VLMNRRMKTERGVAVSDAGGSSVTAMAVNLPDQIEVCPQITQIFAD